MTRRVLTALLAAIVCNTPAFGARLGTNLASDDLVIVWDGGRDVVPAPLFGETTTLAALNLTDYANYAVVATAQSGQTGETTKGIRMIRILLQSDGAVAACAVPLAERPSFCARFKRLDELLSAASLNLLQVAGGLSIEQLTALRAMKMAGFDLVQGESRSIWRFTAADQVAVSAMAALLGPATIHVGMTAQFAGDGTATSPTLQDGSVPPPSAFSPATASGPTAANFTCLTIDPNNAQYVYACAAPPGPRPGGNGYPDAIADAGIFRSLDGGVSWAAANRGLSSRTVRSIAIDPKAPAVLYAAAGSAVYRTSDRAATWTPVRDRSTSGPVNATAVAVDPRTSAVYAAFGFEIDCSTDGGQSWTTVATATNLPSQGLAIRAITITATAPQATLYVDFGDESSTGGTAVQRSRDGGVSWQPLTTPGIGVRDPRIVATDPTDPLVLYAEDGAIYRSADEGSSWEMTALAAPLAVNPASPTEVFSTIGTRIGKGPFSGLPTASLDFGQTPRIIRYSADGRTVLAAGTGKLFRSTNRGATFARMTRGLPLDAVLDLEGLTPSVVPGTLLAATANGGMWASHDRGDTWQPLPDPHMVRQFSIGGPAIAAVFLEQGAGTLWTSSDGAQTWSPIAVPSSSTPTGVQWAQWRGGTLYAYADDRLLSSPNAGMTWPIISAQDLQLTTELAFSPFSSQTFYAVGTLAGEYGVLKTVDGGVTFARLTAVTLPASPAARILYYIDPTAGGATALKVAVGGTIYSSADEGLTWTTTAATDATITAMAQAPSTSLHGATFAGALVIGTDRGVPGQIDLSPGGTPYAQVNALAVTTELGTTALLVRAASDAGVWRPNPGGLTTSAALPPSGGYGSIRVSYGVPPTATADEPWISFLTPLPIPLNTSLVYRVDANTVPHSRTAIVSFGRTILVTQAGRCTFVLTPSSAIVSVAGGTGTITVGTQSGCEWTATPTAPFISVIGSASGSGPGSMSYAVTANAGDSRLGTIEIADREIVIEQGANGTTSMPPFGFFDAPDHDPAGLNPVQGSIALTGWALDDIGVERVEIWRDPQAGEPTPLFTGGSSDPRNGKVFVGNALFVDGARPDVEAAFPLLPLNRRAGWGYLMLTWGLIGQGNGSYTLWAAAIDREHHVTLLGPKTIRADNAHATQPFGSIDSPGIGATVSGVVPTAGWALTPTVNGAPTCRIPSTGVQVTIDSGPPQPVSFGSLRPDVQALFPGFSNSAGAGGGALVDTSHLADGTHTIAWLVTDDCNRSDGIGSRFFTVLNGGVQITGTLTAPAMQGSMTPVAETESADTIAVARGFGEPPQLVPGDGRAPRAVWIAPGERLELGLPQGYDAAWQVVQGERRPLPAGSTWDAAAARLYWQPAPAFLGAYDFVFSNGRERISVRVGVSR